jgi:hypothetical protein
MQSGEAFHGAAVAKPVSQAPYPIGMYRCRAPAPPSAAVGMMPQPLSRKMLALDRQLIAASSTVPALLMAIS